MDPDRIDAMSDEERLAVANLIIDKGVPDGETGSILSMLAKSRSALILPVIEAKIEQVLRSPNPLDCFSDKTVDVPQTTHLLCATIWNVGDQQALREASKLLKVDEKRFDLMARFTMYAAMSDGREFTLAYQGFELGDPAIDKRILPVMEEVLEEELPKVGKAIYDDVQGPRREWAEALVDKYGGTPTEAEWASDPLASRVRPATSEGLHDQVLHFAVDVVQERARK